MGYPGLVFWANLYFPLVSILRTCEEQVLFWTTWTGCHPRHTAILLRAKPSTKFSCRVSKVFSSRWWLNQGEEAGNPERTAVHQFDQSRGESWNLEKQFFHEFYVLLLYVLEANSWRLPIEKSSMSWFQSWSSANQRIPTRWWETIQRQFT